MPPDQRGESLALLFSAGEFSGNRWFEASMLRALGAAGVSVGLPSQASRLHTAWSCAIAPFPGKQMPISVAEEFRESFEKELPLLKSAHLCLCWFFVHLHKAGALVQMVGV